MKLEIIVIPLHQETNKKQKNMGEIILLIWDIIWSLSQIAAVILTIYYSITNDITSSTHYMVLLCLFILIDLKYKPNVSSITISTTEKDGELQKYINESN